MATQTTRAKLRKPATTDLVDVTADISDNMDKIDALISTLICTSATRPASPYQGEVIFESDTFKKYIWSGSAWVQCWLASDSITSPVLNASGYKNFFLNPNFCVAQRGNSGLAGFTYTADQWRLTQGAGSTHTVTRFVPGGATILLEDAEFWLEWNRTVVGSAPSTLGQRIEGASNLSGKQITVSAYMKTSLGSAADVGLSVAQNFGTGGSPSSTVTVTAATQSILTSGVNRYSWTVTLGACIGKTFGTNGDDYLEVLFTRSNATGAANDTLQIMNCQIEEGAVATRFEHRSYAAELAMCQRYYVRMNANAANGIFGVGQCFSTTTAGVIIPFPVTMRAIPTMGQSGTAANFSVLLAAGGRQACTAALSQVAGASTKVAARVDETVGASLVAGNATMLIGSVAATTADFIEFSAEL